VSVFSSEPTVVIEKNTGEGIKIKAIELGLTVVLSERNKIFVKVSLHCVDKSVSTRCIKVILFYTYI